MLSFTISLTYAMLAMMIHQWARRYIRLTQQPRPSPRERARVRAFFSGAPDGLHVLRVIEVVRVMVHLSIFLFLAGLLIYLFNICHAAFAAVVCWVALSTVVYVSFTLLPIFRPNCPYNSPLSSTFCFLYACLSHALFKVLSSPVFSWLGSNAVERFQKLSDRYRKRSLEDFRKFAEETAFQPSSVIDVHVLESIFNALGEDGAWERVFKAVPGFFGSELVHVLKGQLPNGLRIKLIQALNEFLDRTFLFNSLTESVRSGRLVVCLNAAYAALCRDDVSQILLDIRNGRWPELLQSVEMGHSLRRWSNCNNEHFLPYVQRIVAQIVPGIRERDDRWISLIIAEYGIEDRDLQDYIGHGDSVLLSILIHMTRQAFHTGSWTPWILWSLSKFDIRDTLPELQHAFCALWNDIVREAWNSQGSMNIPVQILRELRHAYITLHQGTDAAITAFSASTYHYDPVLRDLLSYRRCNVASHRQSVAIYTPITGSLVVPSPTQVDRSPFASPHGSPIESNHTSNDSTAPQQAEESNVIIESPSPTDRTPHPSHTQEFTDPTLQIHTSETAELSQVPAETSLSSSHPDSVLTTTTLSAKPDRPLAFVQELGDCCDVLQNIPCASLDSNPISKSILTIPTIVVPDSLPHALRSPSSSLTTASSPVSLQVTPVSYVQVSTSIEELDLHRDSSDSNSLNPRAALPYVTQTAMPAHDIVANTLLLEVHVEHDLQQTVDKS